MKELLVKTEEMSTFLEKQRDDYYILFTVDCFQSTLKAWKILKINSRWWIENLQLKENEYFKHEFVRYPISWDTLSDLLNDFQQITNNFTYFFTFPKDEVD